MKGDLMEYSRVFGSRFPEAPIKAGKNKNIDALTAPLVTQYNNCLQKNDLTEAYRLYEENKALLEPYVINSDKCNYWEEELYNTGLMAYSQQTAIVSKEEPAIDQSEGSCWYQEY